MGVALVMKCFISYCQGEQGNAVFAVHVAVKNSALLTRQSTSIIKNGCAMHVVKLTNTNWLVVLQQEFELNTTLYTFISLSLKYLSIRQAKPRNQSYMHFYVFLSDESMLTGVTCSKAPGFWMVEHQLVYTLKLKLVSCMA